MIFDLFNSLNVLRSMRRRLPWPKQKSSTVELNSRPMQEHTFIDLQHDFLCSNTRKTAIITG